MNNVDSPQTTHIGLCAGYGGLELGLRPAIPTLRSVALCEIEAFACANLVAKMEAGFLDSAPIWTDLKTFPWESFRDRVDILTGGYPCQPFSAAGKRAGEDDPRHLWPFIASGIRLLRPRICFFENVEGHISLGLSNVIEDLAGLGYRTTFGIFSASEVGAPHQRKRVFILAHDQRERVKELGWKIAVQSQQHSIRDNGNDAWPSRPGEQQFAWEPPRVVANSNRLAWSAQAEGREHDQQVGSTGEDGGLADSIQRRSDGWPNGISGRLGQSSQDEATDGRRDELKVKPPLGGNFDGTPGRLGHAQLFVSCDNRTDELRLLGNGVVPATAERAFRVLMQELA